MTKYQFRISLFVTLQSNTGQTRAPYTLCVYSTLHQTYLPPLVQYDPWQTLVLANIVDVSLEAFIHVSHIKIVLLPYSILDIMISVNSPLCPLSVRFRLPPWILKLGGLESPADGAQFQWLMY